MSALHEAARRAVSAWVSTRPAWIEQCNEAVLALDAALKAHPEPQDAELSAALGWPGGISDPVLDRKVLLQKVAALKAQPEPAGCETEADCDSQPWCRISGECHRKQKPPEPAQEPEPVSVDQLVMPLVESALQAVAEKIGDQCAVWYGIGARDVEAVLREAARYGLVRTAQTEPAQEPVAVFDERMGQPVLLPGAPMLKDEQPLYTAAQPQRPPLTDEEIVDAVREADLDWQGGWTLDEHEPNRFTTLARAIERKVRGE